MVKNEIQATCLFSVVVWYFDIQSFYSIEELDGIGLCARSGIHKTLLTKTPQLKTEISSEAYILFFTI